MEPDRGWLLGPHPPVGRLERYGELPHQVYELVEPADPGERALVVLVHGGFWRAEWDRTHLRPLARALADQGYAVALVEYARSGMEGGEAGWPTAGQDCRAALAAVRAREGGEVAQGRGDDRPVLIMGHSAGGHLAVWLLHQPEAEGVRGAVSLAGCLDLHLVAELGLDDDAAVDLLGSRPKEAPATWEGADPARLGRTAYPVVAVHGDADEKVPLEVTRSWWEAAADPERDRLVVPAGSTHFPLIDPKAPEHQEVLTALRSLLPAR